MWFLICSAKLASYRFRMTETVVGLPTAVQCCGIREVSC